MSRGGRAVRLWEVDALRGVAILLMVVYHAAWDAAFYGLSGFSVGEGGWLVFARGIGTLFLLLVGVSLTLERSKSSARVGTRSGTGAVTQAGSEPDVGTGARRGTGRTLARGLKVFAWGVGITLVTRLFLPDEYIRFGILHLIGAAVMLSPLVLPLGGWNALLGTAVILAGPALRSVAASLHISPVWGVPLGLSPVGVSMVDYYPLFPWLGAVLLGVAAGTRLYPGGERKYGVRDVPPRAVRGLSAIGRHSLVIYLAHQPVLLTVFFVIRLYVR